LHYGVHIRASLNVYQLTGKYRSIPCGWLRNFVQNYGAAVLVKIKYPMPGAVGPPTAPQDVDQHGLELYALK
jgi:hypothetical protein